MTIKPVWASTAQPEDTTKRLETARARDDIGALTFAHTQIELVTNHDMGQSFGKMINDIKSSPESNDFPDILLMSNFGSLRSITNAISNATQDICVHNKPIKDTIDTFFDGVFLPEFEATAEDRKGLAELLESHKKDYKEKSSFPTLENYCDFILSCHADILGALKNIQNRSEYDLTLIYGATFNKLESFCLEALDKLEKGMRTTDLFTIPTRETGITFIDNARNVLDNALKIQTQVFATQEAELRLDGKIKLAAIADIQKSQCIEALHTLQEYYNNGMWMRFFEDISTNLTQEICYSVDDPEAMTYKDFPPLNEMVGISQFLLDFRAQGLKSHPDIYKDEILVMTDNITQQTLNMCAQMLAVEKPGTPTHTIKLGRH